MVSLLLGILGSVIAWIICSEIDGWGPKLVRHLLAWAVLKLPADRRERYFEEWSAHLETLPTSMSKLFVGVALGFAAVRMRLEVDKATKTSLAAQSIAIRAMDVALSLTGLVLVGPVLLILCIVVYATDPGPIFFGHRRIGKNGLEFRCFKFRTIRVDAEYRLADLLASDPIAPAEWEQNHRLMPDPRMTPIGNFLRWLSLDELPQLFNVLLGTMSLVGPRPIAPAEIKRYGKHFRDYAAVRPGITGLWQISREGKVAYRRKVALDKLFSRKRSLRFYLKLLGLTISMPFNNK